MAEKHAFGGDLGEVESELPSKQMVNEKEYSFKFEFDIFCFWFLVLD